MGDTGYQILQVDGAALSVKFCLLISTIQDNTLSLALRYVKALNFILRVICIF